MLRLLSPQIIQRQLEQVEEKQRQLEERGVAVEKALRGEAGNDLSLVHLNPFSVRFFSLSWPAHTVWSGFHQRQDREKDSGDLHALCSWSAVSNILACIDKTFILTDQPEGIVGFSLF